VDKISILVPTRNRPNFIKDLIQSVVDTSIGDVGKIFDLEFVFRIDDDDTVTVNAINDINFPKIQLHQIRYIIGPRGDGNLSEMWNECWRESTGNIYMLCGDDIRFKTMGWMSKLRNHMDKHGNIGWFYTWDGIHSKGYKGVVGFLHKDWTDVVGTFCPPYFHSDYNDEWFNIVAMKVNRHFYIDVFTEHLHPTKSGEFRKLYLDQTHKDRLERHKKQNSGKVWADTSAERDEWSNKLNAAMEEIKK
jgi:glycosyltransferase involved in cell wall biosynthesis